jgi:hypothetical protein
MKLYDQGSSPDRHHHGAQTNRTDGRLLQHHPRQGQNRLLAQLSSIEKIDAATPRACKKKSRGTRTLTFWSN